MNYSKKTILLLLLANYFFFYVAAQEKTEINSLLKNINDSYIEYRVKRDYDNFVRFRLENGNLRIDKRSHYELISIERLRKIKTFKGNKIYAIKFFCPNGIDVSFSSSKPKGTTTFGDIKTKEGANKILKLLNQLIEKVK